MAVIYIGSLPASCNGNPRVTWYVHLLYSVNGAMLAFTIHIEFCMHELTTAFFRVHISYRLVLCNWWETLYWVENNTTMTVLAWTQKWHHVIKARLNSDVTTPIFLFPFCSHCSMEMLWAVSMQVGDRIIYAMRNPGSGLCSVGVMWLGVVKGTNPSQGKSVIVCVCSQYLLLCHGLWAGIVLVEELCRVSCSLDSMNSCWFWGHMEQTTPAMTLGLPLSLLSCEVLWQKTEASVEQLVGFLSTFLDCAVTVLNGTF